MWGLSYKDLGLIDPQHWGPGDSMDQFEVEDPDSTGLSYYYENGIAINMWQTSPDWVDWQRENNVLDITKCLGLIPGDMKWKDSGKIQKETSPLEREKMDV